MQCRALGGHPPGIIKSSTEMDRWKGPETERNTKWQMCSHLATVLQQCSERLALPQRHQSRYAQLFRLGNCSTGGECGEDELGVAVCLEMQIFAQNVRWRCRPVSMHSLRFGITTRVCLWLLLATEDTILCSRKALGAHLSCATHPFCFRRRPTRKNAAYSRQ